MTQDPPACRTCRFYDRVFGTCRCSAPAIVPGYEGLRDRSRYEAMWPRVDADDWCGRHEPGEPRS